MFDKYIMNYTLHYEKLIDRAQARQLDCYTETHHIIPVCIGGTDSVSNLVELTPEEHLVAHLLLMKINNNKSLVYAAMRMHNRVKNNKEYGYLRRQFAGIMREKMSGTGNAMYGKHHTDAAKQKISAGNTGKKRTNELRAQQREARLGVSPGNKGKKHTPEALQKIKEASTGENNPMYGKCHSEETKRKIGIKSVGRKPRLGIKLSAETKEKCSIAALNRVPKECEHCHRLISPSNYSRWHGNNCKLKDTHD